MSKALVIKSADFSTNALKTVHLINDIPVPCTGLSFASNAISITGYDPVSIEYTVTPSNTTDVLTWESSDNNVVTVSNGVLTAVGIGSATVTARCGSYSASATVTVSLSYIPHWFAIYLNTSNGAVTATDSTYRAVAFGTGGQASTYKTATTGSQTAWSAIKIPKNTASIRLSIPSGSASLFKNDGITSIKWAKDESAGWDTYPNAIKYVSETASYNIRNSVNMIKTFEVPDGVDSFFVITRLATDPETLAADLTETMIDTGFQIEFLTAS